jgi:hypothetical protein
MTKSGDIDAGNANATGENREYAAFAHSFRDPWKDADVELTYRFARPTKTQIKRLSDTAGKNAIQAARDLLLGTVHPDDKDKLLSDLEDYPGIAMSFSTGIIKTVGISSDLGN